jgi:hypothetical protein
MLKPDTGQSDRLIKLDIDRGNDELINKAAAMRRSTASEPVSRE